MKKAESIKELDKARQENIGVKIKITEVRRDTDPRSFTSV